jgi:hypothetical protein
MLLGRVSQLGVSALRALHDSPSEYGHHDHAALDGNNHDELVTIKVRARDAPIAIAGSSACRSLERMKNIRRVCTTKSQALTSVTGKPHATCSGVPADCFEGIRGIH